VSEPHYWNRDNFVGLAKLAELLRSDASLTDLAEYCRLREDGRRREAFARLDNFLSTAAAWSLESKREAALKILSAHAAVSAAHQFLTTPLRRRFLEPVLTEWCQSEPEASLPVRWLGLLLRDQEILQKALTLDPRDDQVRIALAQLFVAAVDDWCVARGRTYRWSCIVYYDD
jgi:hypothetical protein